MTQPASREGEHEFREAKGFPCTNTEISWECRKNKADVTILCTILIRVTPVHPLPFLTQHPTLTIRIEADLV
jgi:hypothetical protein